MCQGKLSGLVDVAAIKSFRTGVSKIMQVGCLRVEVIRKDGENNAYWGNKCWDNCRFIIILVFFSQRNKE